jgi:hypothetical protein
LSQIELILKLVDNDNCRIYVTSPIGNLYCFQLETRGDFAMYECTPEGEPLAHVDITRFLAPFVDNEDSDIRIASEYNEWLGNKLSYGGPGRAIRY